MTDFFKGRKLVVATKHEKDKVIAPLVEKELSVICFVPADFDTDILGTFTGEVERKDDSITTLRNKCKLALKQTGCDLAVGNEGSFGPHPTIPFARADDELMMLYDKLNGIEIIERELSLETNFDGCEIGSEQALLKFADKVKFPSHGIILKKSKNDFSVVLKGITSEEGLLAGFQQIKLTNGTAYAETDMRAMYNPTRMGIIRKATEKLIKKTNSLCPQCAKPGFGVVEAVKGLPCDRCGLPTRSTLKQIYRCQKCNFQMEEEFPFGKQVEDPQYCYYCNP